MSADSYSIRDQHAVHFLTFTIVEWIDVFMRASYKIEIANSLEYCRKHKGLKLYAFCLMGHHIHLIYENPESFLMNKSCKCLLNEDWWYVVADE